MLTTSNYHYRFVFFLSSIKSSFNFCFMYFEVMLFITYTFGMVSSISQPFLLLWNPTLSLIILHVLMSTFSDIYTATPTLWLEGVWYIFFQTILLLTYLCIYICMFLIKNIVVLYFFQSVWKNCQIIWQSVLLRTTLCQ